MANTVNTHKDFPSLVNAIIDSRLDNLWTCIPAIVIDVDYAAHSCSIRPKMKINGSEMPILLQVPIMKANNSVIISLKRDDIVLALFSKYSLTELLKDRNPASTKTESRQFAIDDAIVIGGMFLSTDLNNFEIWVFEETT